MCCLDPRWFIGELGRSPVRPCVRIRRSGYVGASLDDYPDLKAYFEGIKDLPNVKDAHARMATTPATTC